MGFPIDKPIPLKYEAIHRGNATTHHTHILYTYKGLVYCNKCGMKSNSELRKLSHPCNPPTEYGLANLKAIAEGNLPSVYKPRNKPTPSKHSTPTSRPLPSRIGLLHQQQQPTDEQKYTTFFGNLRTDSNFNSPSTITSSSSNIPPNTRDLLELANAGEQVIWPQGLDYVIASSLIQQEDALIATRSLPNVPQERGPFDFPYGSAEQEPLCNSAPRLQGIDQEQSGDPSPPKVYPRQESHPVPRPKPKLGPCTFRRCITSLKEYRSRTRSVGFKVDNASASSSHAISNDMHQEHNVLREFVFNSRHPDLRRVLGRVRTAAADT